nr:general transcription factor IIH subunit 2-like isoform X2 [Physcomitrium patens]|eukprot:XP_024364305.1 general transcription factor IIH subunit 2-like isoform X2 [Physcomitrella patens]
MAWRRTNPWPTGVPSSANTRTSAPGKSSRKMSRECCALMWRSNSASTVSVCPPWRGLVFSAASSAAEMDLRPSRMGIVVDCVEAFVREFFDQNPLSHLGVILLKDGIAHQLTDLSGSPETHIRALRSNMESTGDASIQNGLDLARGYLTQIPSYGHREVLLVYSALSTIDPGDVMETVQECKKANIRCSVVGLSAEIYICKLLCEQTGGMYSVATNEGHLKELIMEHAPPPAAQAEMSVASLVRMGFPQRGAEDAVALCACHREVKMGGGYTCPRCKARVCELPTQCHICGLTLVSSPHLARSYHHLFPVSPFEEVENLASANGRQSLSKSCYGCLQELPTPGGKVKGVRLECPRCRQHFCFDCDNYIHESLHNCPGCESNSVILSQLSQ